MKEKYLKISGVYYALIGLRVNKFLEKILNALSAICQDEEPVIIDAVRQICIILGKYADQELVLSSILQMVIRTFLLLMSSDLFDDIAGW